MRTAIIIEDEILASRRLKRLLESIDANVNILEIFETIEDSATYLLSVTKQPDIIFLDIQLSDGNSFELFNILDIKSCIILTTAYDEYAVQAFRQNATDYLLKPIKKDQLKEALQKAEPIQMSVVSENTNLYKSRFLIRFGTKFHSVKTEDIAYVYSKNKILYFYTFNGDRIPSDYKLQDLEGMLNPDHFFRVNRQFMVNIESIAQITRHGSARVNLKLQPAINEQIIISTEKTRLFKKWMNR